jgi:hypothetical protein
MLQPDKSNDQQLSLVSYKPALCKGLNHFLFVFVICVYLCLLFILAKNKSHNPTTNDQHYHSSYKLAPRELPKSFFFAICLLGRVRYTRTDQ